MRMECQRAEVALSYLRRVAQSRLDLVKKVLELNTPGSEGHELDLSSIVGEMTAILSEGPSRPSGPGRPPVIFAPDFEKDDLTGELDEMFDVSRLTNPSELGDVELRTIADRLREEEAKLSQQRRSLHGCVDHLESELVGRYKNGRASVDGLLD